ncbi:ferredoxin [Saccharopolyspora elongata]|uniref:Ferredoxin n=1 Tax=Saccharopolyspora elongata TaxID=2530387 RepID=A0A4R4ZE88_9PSEU|nr:ferredoxin [Saccharopolyspora elongata]TDD56645.1 ferredoxin [Saccharopolyspora elongata]
MRIEIDRDRCVGAGMCALAAPSVFDQNEEDGLVLLVDAEPPEEARESVRTAAVTCPSGAVAVS